MQNRTAAGKMPGPPIFACAFRRASFEKCLAMFDAHELAKAKIE